MKNALNPQVVVVQKSSLDPDRRSRNSLIDLFVRAGYDRVLSGFDRKDEIAQDDLLIRGVKGPDALAAQFELYSDRSIGVLVGTDVLAEADLAARQRGVRSEIARILSLEIGRCSLTFLSPEETALKGSEGLESRIIFSKYPRILAAVLRGLKVRASVRQSDGADTRVNEWRGRNAVAAFEIVESGETARKNALRIMEGEISFPAGEKIGLPYLDLLNISTDLYVTRISRMTARERDALRALGLALESARQTNRYASFRFNIPTGCKSEFRDLGMKGPTYSPVESRDGNPWSAGEILVPLERKNAMRMELLRRGACDLCSGEPLNVEVSADASEVLSALPFIAPETGSGENQGDAAPAAEKLKETFAFLLPLEQTIAERAVSCDRTSGTWRALEQGTEFCSTKCCEEVLEFLQALSAEGRERVLEEAADLLYRFLVALRSKGVELSAVFDSDDDAAGSASKERNLPIIRLAGAATRFSSAARKQSQEQTAQAAKEMLFAILLELREAGIDATQVADCLQMRQSPSK